MRYAVISAINLAILLVGIALGVMLAPHIEKTVTLVPPRPKPRLEHQLLLRQVPIKRPSPSLLRGLWAFTLS